MNIVINKKIEVQSLGLKEYQDTWQYQEKLFKSIIDNKLANRNLKKNKQIVTPNYLLFVEHPHVYTIGKSGNENNLLLNQKELIEKEASYFKTNRGGDITYHGPGQLVCYPIFDLDNFFNDIHKYLRLLEEAVILTLANYAIEGYRIKKFTGVWVDSKKRNIQSKLLKPKKICAMGVKTSRWVTMHGLALNVNTNLNYFGNIIPCGIEDKAVTSVSNELGEIINLPEIQNILKNNIIKLFNMEEKINGEDK